MPFGGVVVVTRVQTASTPLERVSPMPFGGVVVVTAGSIVKRLTGQVSNAFRRGGRGDEKGCY